MKRVYFIFSLLLLLNFLYLHTLDYTIPPNTYSIQSGDIDNDGDNDIAVGHINNDTYLSILFNNGNGEFDIDQCLASTEARMFYKIGDFDENNIPDFIIQNQYLYMIIFYNSDFENPYYYDLQSEHGFKQISFGDFGTDGDDDLVLASYGPGQENLWAIMRNLGNREFADPEWDECPNQASNAGFYNLICKDIDNNNRDDIIAYTNYETYIYYNHFNHIVLDSLDCAAPNGNMVSEDFDNDNDYDIIVTHWPGGQQSHFLIYENIGNHEFILHDVTYQDSWGEPYAADINNDGLMDIVNVGGGIESFINQGEMDFSVIEEQDYPYYGESWVKPSFSDFDGNGIIDVAFVRYGIEENNLTILYNDGEGNFMEEPQTGINNYELIINNFDLSNYPNPFNQTTIISYELPVNVENAKIKIFNIKGQKVKQLVSDQQSAGQHSFVWDGRNNFGHEVGSGVYLYKLDVNCKTRAVKKCLLFR